MVRIEDILHKMMRRFYSSNEHAKELTCDFDNIGFKVDAHAVSINHVELQMDQLYTTMNPR